MSDSLIPLVVCLCPVFNEVDYVERTLKGFVEQETTFPFVVVVHDDASTDGSDKVIMQYARRYPDIIRAVIEPSGSNMYSKGLLGKKLRELLGEYDCKYVAKCEGDDFWINKKKLQMQVEYMESHPECVMCYTDCHVGDSNGRITKKNFIKRTGKIPQCFEDHLLTAGYIAPPTWLIKSEIYKTLGPYKGLSDASLAMALDLFQLGDVHYIDEATAVYTNRQGGLSSPKSIGQQWKYERGVFDTQLFIANKYGCGSELISRLKIQEYAQLMFMAIEVGDKKFVAEAETFFVSQGLDMQWFIAKCREYVGYHQKYNTVSGSWAYRIGRKLLYPIKNIRR